MTEIKKSAGRPPALYKKKMVSFRLHPKLKELGKHLDVDLGE